MTKKPMSDDLRQLCEVGPIHYKSVMNIEFGLDWAILIVVILALLYTMRVIKKEKDVALKNAKIYSLNKIQIHTAPWWSCTTQNESELIFERTDTRYDWKGTFTALPLPAAEFDLREKFIDIIKSKNLLLDEIHVFAPAEREYEGHRVFHIESTATMGGIERVYYDAYLAYSPRDQALYYFESLSSVLNGMVEGPYFEEAARTFKRISD